MAVFATIGGLISKKPTVPKFKPVDAQKEQMKAIEGNIKALPELKTLGQETQAQLIDQIKTGVEELFPGATAIQKKAFENITSGLSGELPKDVSDMLARQAAEKAVSTGTVGSQFADFRELRNLGLTSLARIDSTMNTALQWITTALSATPTVDVSRFFISPEVQIQHAVNERNSQFNAQWLRSQVRAQTADRSIIGQGMIQFDRDIVNIGSSLIGMAGGGMGGGGGAAPTQQFTFNPGPGTSTGGYSPSVSGGSGLQNLSRTYDLGPA